MKHIHQFIYKHPQLAFLLTGVLLFIVYLVNLGLLPLFADEPTRAVVALEMMLNDNYWVPTINGEYYYRKPPLYNWIIVGLFQSTGSMSEFVFRLPSVIPLFLFGFTIYWWSKNFITNSMAFLAAGMFVTCGRMLIYASFIGHIDIFYSWITFLSFICLIEYGKKEKWWQFFIFSYALCAIGFLCKGLPTVVFQGISVVTILIILKHFKKFFSFPHLIGILVFLIPVGGYFLKYAEHNELMGWVDQLWDQSVQRTPKDKPWYETVLHIFKFPLDHLYHLAPWSLFAIFLFRKDLKSTLFQSLDIKLISILFLANLPIYWLSPGYYPRYLFMLYPLLFIIMAFAFNKSKNEKLKSGLFKVLLGLGLVLIIGTIIVYFLPQIGTTFSALQCLIVLLTACLALFLLRSKPTPQIIGAVILLASFRLLFNWVVMPERLASGNTGVYREDAIRIAHRTKDIPTKLVKWSSVNHETTFYFEREKHQILTHTKGIDARKFNIVDKLHLQSTSNKQIIDSMLIRHGNKYLYLLEYSD